MLGQEFMGFEWIWWMGRVENTQDPKELGRVKVRIYGFHAQDYQKLPTTSLPWAQVMMPCTSASQGGTGQTHGLQVGSWVGGFFADGRRGQYPVVMGSFHGVHATAYTQSDGAGVSSGLGPTGAVNTPITGAGTPSLSSLTSYTGSAASAISALSAGSGTASTATAAAVSSGSILPSTGQSVAGTTAISGSSSIWSGSGVYSDTSSLSSSILTQQSTILGGTNAQIFLATLFIADAVSTYAQNVDGVTLIVPAGGGVNSESLNHSSGESIDLIPSGGWDYSYSVQDSSTGIIYNQAQMYASIASAFGANRIGIPQLESGSTMPLHVQLSQDPSIGGTGYPAGIWGYPGSNTATAFGQSGSSTAVSAAFLSNFTYTANGVTGGFTPSSIPNISALTAAASINQTSSLSPPSIIPSTTSPASIIGQLANNSSGGPLSIPSLASYNPMNEYSGEAVSIGPYAKSPDNPTITTKSDQNAAQDTTRSYPYRLADGGAAGEKLSSDVGSATTVKTWVDPMLNGVVLDSTPGANRVKIVAPLSYQEWDQQGNHTQRTGGDHTSVSRGNYSLAADKNLALSAGNGSARLWAAGNIDHKCNGSATIDAGGSLNLTSLGSGVLKFSGDLVIQARSIKLIADGGGVDIRAGDEINLEAGANMNIQCPGDMSFEANGNIYQDTHANLISRADKDIAIGSGGNTSILANTNMMVQSATGSMSLTAPSGNILAQALGEYSLGTGGQIKMQSGDSVNIQAGSDVVMQGNHIDCKGIVRATKFSSKNVPDIPAVGTPYGELALGTNMGDDPNSPQSSDPASTAADPMTAIKAKANTLSQIGRNTGSGGGLVAASSRAVASVDPQAVEGTASSLSATSVTPAAVTNSQDSASQVNDAAPTTTST